MKRQVLLFNHADADESFVAELTPEQIERCRVAQRRGDGFSQELMEECRAAEVEMPMFCYYA